MKILIVDDSIDKIADIISCIQGVSKSFVVDSVYSSVTALNKIKSEKYDLLIFDVFLPFRDNEKPDESGGFKLVSQISREKTINRPLYLLGLSQYETSGKITVWPVVKYERESNTWQPLIKEIITHILKVNDTENRISIKPRVFLEGNTDLRIIKRAFELFLADKIISLELKSEKNAGASWVARQIVSWSCQLHRNEDNNYIKAVGVLDLDIAGNEANIEINRMVQADSAQSKTFKIIKLNAKYAEHLKPLYTKGLNLPITLESLFPMNVWKYAHSNNWLEKRNDGEQLLKDPKNWDKYSCGIMDHLRNLGLTTDELVFLMQVKDDCKEKCISYILSLEEADQRIILSGFEVLVKDVVAAIES